MALSRFCFQAVTLFGSHTLPSKLLHAAFVFNEHVLCAGIVMSSDGKKDYIILKYTEDGRSFQDW